MREKQFEYTLKFNNNRIVMSDYRRNVVILNNQVDRLVKSIEHNSIKNFINYDNDVLIVTLDNGAIVLKEYKKFFALDEFESIKKKYLDKIRKEKINIVKEKGKYIALTSSLIIGLLCGSRFNKFDLSKNNANDYAIEKINPDDIANQMKTINSQDLNNYASESSNKQDDELNSTNVVDSESYMVDVCYGNNTNSEKLISAESDYNEIIEKYSKKYGLDYYLVLALCTQERGIHSTTIDNGGGLGLMQIQVKAHPDGSNISTTIFDDNGIPQQSSFTFYKNNYKDLDGNIEAGCAILRNYLDSFNGNIVAALYSYNFGNGAVKKAINKYADKNGINYNDVVLNYDNYDWNKYLVNDSNNYFDAVMQYFIGDSINYYGVKYDENNNLISQALSCNLNNQENVSMTK